MLLRKLLVCLALLPVTAAAPDDDVSMRRLDQVQIIATHNSYHRQPGPMLLRWLRTSGFSDGPEWSGERLAAAIDYDYPTLAAQLDMGVRALELDVHDDPDGGLFERPPFIAAMAKAGMLPDRAWDAKAMRRPGFKVLHKAGYDPYSSCPQLSQCLQGIGNWSTRHPDHAPITLMIEVKSGGVKEAGCIKLCPDGWGRLKRELVETLGLSHLLLPTQVGATWPTIAQARGKILLLLLDDEATAASYRAATRRDGQDIIFTAARPGRGKPLRLHPGDRFAILPDPADPRIGDARRHGALVYTRADADTEEARRGDARRRDRAFASGANFIATDFPTAETRRGDYAVAFAGRRYVRCHGDGC